MNLEVFFYLFNSKTEFVNVMIYARMLSTRHIKYRIVVAVKLNVMYFKLKNAHL